MVHDWDFATVFFEDLSLLFCHLTRFADKPSIKLVLVVELKTLSGSFKQLFTLLEVISLVNLLKDLGHFAKVVLNSSVKDFVRLLFANKFGNCSQDVNLSPLFSEVAQVSQAVRHVKGHKDN